MVTKKQTISFESDKRLSKFVQDIIFTALTGDGAENINIDFKHPKKIRILCWPRQAGKTTECRQFLKDNPGSMAICPTVMQAKHLNKHRTYTAGLVGNLYKCTNSVCMDEIDFIDRELVEKVLLHCDNVLLTGTPKKGNFGKGIFGYLNEMYPECFSFRRIWE